MNWKHLVWNAVEKFRKEYPCPEMALLPIDTLYIADAVLRLSVVEMDDFKARYGCEAAISSDFTEILVDSESCETNASGTGWRFNRLRFSIAHEIGHLCLHKEEFEKSGFTDFESFLDWTNTLGGRRDWIEKEANEFAGRLLVPVDRLKAELSKMEDTFNNLMPGWRGRDSLRIEAAESIAPKFGVSAQTILTRFTREGLWPEP